MMILFKTNVMEFNIIIFNNTKFKSVSYNGSSVIKSKRSIDFTVTIWIVLFHYLNYIT